MAIRVRRPAVRGAVEVGGFERGAAVRDHFLPGPEEGVGAGQPVGDHRRQGGIVRVVSGLIEGVAETQLGLPELAGGEGHGAEHAAAQGGWRRGLDGLAALQASGLLDEHQVERGREQASLPIGAGRGDIGGPQEVGRGGRQPAASGVLGS